MPVPTTQAPVYEPEPEYQIEIDPHAPPFETPANSESYLARNGFCHADQFGVIVDPETGYTGGELVYTPPSLRESDLDSYAQVRLCDEPVEIGPDELDFITTVEMIQQAYREGYEAYDGDGIEHLYEREYTLSIDEYDVTYHQCNIFGHLIDHCLEEATDRITRGRLQEIFDDVLYLSMPFEDEEPERLTLDPAATWRLRALTLYQQGVSRNANQCKIQALEEQGVDLEPIAEAFEQDPNEIGGLLVELVG